MAPCKHTTEQKTNSRSDIQQVTDHLFNAADCVLARYNDFLGSTLGGGQIRDIYYLILKLIKSSISEMTSLMSSRRTKEAFPSNDGPKVEKLI